MELGPHPPERLRGPGVLCSLGFASGCALVFQATASSQQTQVHPLGKRMNSLNGSNHIKPGPNSIRMPVTWMGAFAYSKTGLRVPVPVGSCSTGLRLRVGLFVLIAEHRRAQRSERARYPKTEPFTVQYRCSGCCFVCLTRFQGHSI